MHSNGTYTTQVDKNTVTYTEIIKFQAHDMVTIRVWFVLSLLRFKTKSGEKQKTKSFFVFFRFKTKIEKQMNSKH